MNHSCDPNVVHFLEQGQLRVRALKPIKAGEELTMSYLIDDPGYFLYEQRQAYIAENLHIECECKLLSANDLGNSRG